MSNMAMPLTPAPTIFCGQDLTSCLPTTLGSGKSLLKIVEMKGFFMAAMRDLAQKI